MWSNPPQYLDTIAEGIKNQQCGFKNFPILCDFMEEDVITVSDKEMIYGMKLAAEHMKIVVEAAAGAAIAAAICHQDKIRKCWPHVQKIGVIICGGNTNLFNKQ